MSYACSRPAAQKGEKMTIKEQAYEMKLNAPVLAGLDGHTRNAALLKVAEALNANAGRIFAANDEDVKEAKKQELPKTIIKRLVFNEAKLADVTEGIRLLTTLPDPVGNVSLERELDEGLLLRRVSCPIGVIGVIFESRPDALVQISSLCIKSGNAAVLKGGKEAAKTNQVLFEIIHAAAVEAGLPDSCLFLATSHAEIDELLACDESVDLLIPRGSNSFVRYIMDHTHIPVMGHADGICHVYVDEEYDKDRVLDIIIDAKCQYPAACNAAETLLVNEKIAPQLLPALKERAAAAGMTLRGTKETAALLDCEVIEDGEAFRREYGDTVMAVKLVKDTAEAAAHINRFGSHHTDSIITNNDEHAAYFMRMVDSAGVYRNCSTRFADGFRYGFGAEVGISTGKLHARGPVGLEGLVTYKYELHGNGQIVGDYASGKSQFHFKDL